MKVRDYLVEQKGKARIKPKLQKLDDQIDKFISDIIKEIDKYEDNPVFQKKMNQMLVDLSKEQSEFLVALSQLVTSLDRGPQMIPKRRAHARGVPPPESGFEGPDPEVQNMGAKQMANKGVENAED